MFSLLFHSPVSHSLAALPYCRCTISRSYWSTEIFLPSGVEGWILPNRPIYLRLLLIKGFHVRIGIQTTCKWRLWGCQFYFSVVKFQHFHCSRLRGRRHRLKLLIVLIYLFFFCLSLINVFTIQSESFCKAKYFYKQYKTKSVCFAFFSPRWKTFSLEQEQRQKCPDLSPGAQDNICKKLELLKSYFL